MRGEFGIRYIVVVRTNGGLLPEGGLGLVEPPVKLRNWYVCFMSGMVAGLGVCGKGEVAVLGGSPH